MVPQIVHDQDYHPYGYFADPQSFAPLKTQPGDLDVRHHGTTRRYTILEPVLFVDPAGNHWFVDAPYVFNGLSVPRWLWWLCPPDEPRAFRASVIHDRMCDDTLPRLCDSITAAHIFWLGMRAGGYYEFGANRNWLAVSLFGPVFDGPRFNVLKESV